jgi:N,N-dimethylformamidase
VSWLEHAGHSYDVFTDSDLHRSGVTLLSDYRCILLGSHPEYWTFPMLRALRGYLEAGGRAVYLGGNGLYWVTSIDEARPHLIECRKTQDGELDPWQIPPPGEWEHSTTSELGGTWARRGHPPRATVGVEFSGSVFGPPSPAPAFRRTDASRQPPYGFIFQGVGEEEIGGFGLNLGTAAGYEIDSVQDWSGAHQPVLLARAEHDAYVHLESAPVAPSADIALLLYPDGGAVFAAGSVTWGGSLSHNGYDNSVARITANVVERFLEAPAGASVLDEPEYLGQ